MLSLPLIPPRPDASLWPSLRTTITYLDTPSPDPHTHTQTSTTHTTHQRRPNSHHSHDAHSRSLLASLTADEKTIHQRKQNVRRFGAGWIRPPGVAKTYQAMLDEEAERAEQEILARREQVLLDLAAAQTETQNQETAAEGQDEEMNLDEERDLDDEIPDAEADGDESSVVSSDDDDDDDDEEEEEEVASGHSVGETSAIGERSTMTFNEDSFIEGSMVAEVEHMLEMEEAEIEGVLQEERDLDDDVPEAGSYEHTDSDMDSSFDEAANANTSSRVSLGSLSRRRRSNGRVSSGRRSSGRRSEVGSGNAMPPRAGIGLVEATNRSSFGLDASSILDGSSFLRSSPAAVRGSLRSRFMSARGPRQE